MATGKSTSQALRKAALRLPGAEEGIACKGTALEAATVGVRNKAFLFVRSTDARLKLQESRSEAAKLAAKDPDHFSLGANGWVLITYGDGRSPPLDLMKRWIEESFRVIVGPKGRGAGTSGKSTRGSKAQAGAPRPGRNLPRRGPGSARRSRTQGIR